MSTIRQFTTVSLRSPAPVMTPSNASPIVPKESGWNKFKDEMKHIGEEIKDGVDKLAKETKDFVVDEFNKAYHSPFVQNEIADFHKLEKSGEALLSDASKKIENATIPLASNFIKKCGSDLIECLETGTIKNFGNDLLKDSCVFGTEVLGVVKTVAINEESSQNATDIWQTLKDMVNFNQNNPNHSSTSPLVKYC